MNILDPSSPRSFWQESLANLKSLIKWSNLRNRRRPSRPTQVSCRLVVPSSYKFKYHPDGRLNSWREVISAVDKYDKDLCEGWSKDIDSTLLFAGLFSATVTAFTLESYKWLNEDPADVTVRLLAQLSQNLGAIPAADYPPFEVTAAAIRINIVWFLSLIITLSSALIGILCKRWIRRYQRDTAQEAFGSGLCQLRYESWGYRRMPDVISSTSLLLQAALLLFFTGVVDLLWSQPHVKILSYVITVTVGLSILFILVTKVAMGRSSWTRRKEWDNSAVDQDIFVDIEANRMLDGPPYKSS